MTQAFSDFVGRHIGFTEADQAAMLAALGFDSLDSLVDAAVPSGVRSSTGSSIPAPASEAEVLAELRELSERNKPGVCMIGLGYHGTVTPGVIRRRVLESPAWYTDLFLTSR